MKIVHIFDHSFPLQDGYSARSLAILQEQKNRGWEVFPLTGPRQGSTKDEKESVFGINFFRTKNRGGFMFKLPLVKQFWSIWVIYKRLITVVGETKPDVLHAHSPALNGVAALWVARRYKLPLVYEVRAFWEDAAVDQGTSTPEGFRYKITRALENHVFGKAQQVTTICEGLKRDIDSRNLCSSPVVVIPNAVETDRFLKLLPREEALASSYGLTEDFTLGFIGSFYDYEGIDLAIRAMPKLLKINPKLKLLLVGGGVQGAALRTLTAELHLEKEVIFTGRVNFDHVEKYYSIIDILVYPRKSLRLTELVTPLKPLEAMAQKKVFIASDVGGHKELIKHGETGILFKADCIDSYVKAVQELIFSKKLQNSLKKHGLDFVCNERNWVKSVEKYEDVYSSALLKIN
jgi:PEP-CTERM/exosortase A-associated glycosyltransferase